MSFPTLYVRLDNDLLGSAEWELNRIPSVSLVLHRSAQGPPVHFRAICSNTTSENFLLKSFYLNTVVQEDSNNGVVKEPFGSVIPIEWLGISHCFYFTSSSETLPVVEGEEDAAHAPQLDVIPNKSPWIARVPFSYRDWSFSPAFLLVDHLGLDTSARWDFVGILGRRFFNQYGFFTESEGQGWAIRLPLKKLETNLCVYAAVESYDETPSFLSKLMNAGDGGCMQRSFKAGYGVLCGRTSRFHALSAPLEWRRNHIHHHRATLWGVEHALRMLYQYGLVDWEIKICLSSRDAIATLFEANSVPDSAQWNGEGFILRPRQLYNTTLRDQGWPNEDVLRLIDWWASDLLRMGTKVYVVPTNQGNERAKTLARHGANAGQVQLWDHPGRELVNPVVYKEVGPAMLRTDPCFNICGSATAK